MAQKKVILLLSGEIGAGKSTLANNLHNRFDFNIFKTKDVLKKLGISKLRGEEPDRDFLQQYGEKLDKKDSGKWVLTNFANDYYRPEDTNSFYVVDAVRILGQINHFRTAYSYIVFHIHLTASSECLRSRYLIRHEDEYPTKTLAKQSYDRSKSNPTEQKVPQLSKLADIVINTELCTEEDVLVRVASFFNLLGPTKNELVDIVIGGQFGSEGKGQVSAHIAPEYDCLVRTGGPNAGHTVYETPNKHVFHHLPSGSYRNQTAKLVLGPGSVINHDNILKEISTYGILDEFNQRLIIDENATIISEKDIKAEQRYQIKIGSTAQGVGYATAGNIIERIKGSDKHKAKYFPKLKPFIGSAHEVLERMYRNKKRILLEGTQGSGLSIHHGLYPYVTSRDTTVSGCLAEAGISPKRVRRIIMVTRSYPIRVGGNSGPFISSEISMKEVARRSGKNAKELIKKEITTTTKRERRIAEFSWTLFRRACELNSPTDIALTFTDYISINNENARRYDQLTPETRQLIEEIENCSGVKVSLISTCFDYRAIIDRRNWKTP